MRTGRTRKMPMTRQKTTPRECGASGAHKTCYGKVHKGAHTECSNLSATAKFVRFSMGMVVFSPRSQQRAGPFASVRSARILSQAKFLLLFFETNNNVDKLVTVHRICE